MTQAERIELFCSAIWAWYARHKRALPWRDLQVSDVNQKAYMIYISEVMLQQTQVSRVQIKWKQWLEVFPTLQDLAKASNTQVIHAWEGMGYNSRALRLRDAAETIVRQATGFPVELPDLLAIKGIGSYTAAAIRNFAYGLPTPCIDTNIRRILHRTFYGPETQYGEWKRSDADLRILAENVLATALNKKFVQEYEQFWQSSPTAEWHAALMDYGSLVCTKINPKWDVSPLAKQGISKAAYKVPKQRKKPSKEPGRIIAGKFTPNRIIRGRIVQQLREHSDGLFASQIGPLVCIDWNPSEHEQWLGALLQVLLKDDLVKEENGLFTL